MKYEAPRGEIRDPDIDLEDISYDGILDGNMMKGGLGQLVDGLYGDDDYQKLLQGEHSGMSTTILNVCYRTFFMKLSHKTLCG